MGGKSRIGWLVAVALICSSGLPAAEVLKQKMIGRWELDPQRSHSLGGKSAQMVSQYQRAGIRMFLEFRTDDSAITTMISPAGRQTAPTKWKVVKENVRAITIEMTDKKSDLTSLGIGEFLNDDVVKMTTRIKGAAGAAPAMIYRRIR